MQDPQLQLALAQQLFLPPNLFIYFANSQLHSNATLCKRRSYFNCQSLQDFCEKQKSKNKK